MESDFWFFMLWIWRLIFPGGHVFNFWSFSSLSGSQQDVWIRPSPCYPSAGARIGVSGSSSCQSDSGEPCSEGQSSHGASSPGAWSYTAPKPHPPEDPMPRGSHTQLLPAPTMPAWLLPLIQPYPGIITFSNIHHPTLPPITCLPRLSPKPSIYIRFLVTPVTSRSIFSLNFWDPIYYGQTVLFFQLAWLSFSSHSIFWCLKNQRVDRRKWEWLITKTSIDFESKQKKQQQHRHWALMWKNSNKGLSPNFHPTFVLEVQFSSFLFILIFFFCKSERKYHRG